MALRESQVTVVSFGYGHGAAPLAHATFDVRQHFRDPHVSPALRGLTAADQAVADAVRSTPGVPGLTGAIAAAARAFLSGPCQDQLTIAVGCVGGRHRSAVIAADAASLLESEGVTVTLSHRDIERPVIGRPMDHGRERRQGNGTTRQQERS